jgi:spore germination cell wall hydrolase CwlJ-like protein
MRAAILVGGLMLSPLVQASGELLGVEGAGHACIALTVFAEARGEPYEGQAAVAQTIINRLRANPDRYVDPCDVVLRDNQFHGIRDWPPPRNPRKRDEEAWELALQVTYDVTVGGYVVEPAACRNALYFIEAGTPVPSWVADMESCRIGDHLFFSPAEPEPGQSPD